MRMYAHRHPIFVTTHCCVIGHPLRSTCQLLIRGVGHADCRHGSVVGACNMFGGESHAFAILAVWTYVQLARTRVAFLWYDIGCRWLPSFQRWRDQLPEGDMVKRLTLLMLSPIPPMHVHAHQ